MLDKIENFFLKKTKKNAWLFIAVRIMTIFGSLPSLLIWLYNARSDDRLLAAGLLGIFMGALIGGYFILLIITTSTYRLYFYVRSKFD